MGFLKESVAFGVPPAYSRYKRLRPRGEICWFGVNFPRDLKCQILSSRTLEIAFKRRKEANINIYIYIYIRFFLLRNQNNLKLSLLIESL